ncbi:hypothetical protein [Acinetobacter proteolyticus]|uniref:hypothetical protein n=1 Tax=Acinetobacter proteolyticus TaxID=1776741 RepID=UPI003D9934DD
MTNKSILLVLLVPQLIAVTACVYLLNVVMAFSVVCLWASAIGLGINIAKAYPKF